MTNPVTSTAASVQGTVRMLDGMTPHVAVPIQAVRLAGGSSQVIQTVLTDDVGCYRFVDLAEGDYQIRCPLPGGHFQYPESGCGEVLEAGRQQTVSGIDFRLPPLKHGHWTTLSYLDGLLSNEVTSMVSDADGAMWFGTRDGVSRYDGKTFTNCTTSDGLAFNHVWASCCDPDGILWFGGYHGVSRFDDGKFTNFTMDDGLPSNSVWGIYPEPQGELWFGTHGGASWFDGKTFTNFFVDDVSPNNWVRCIYRSPDGILWFGRAGCVSRYDGHEFTHLTTEDGLVYNSVWDICRDAEGNLWFGTHEGVSCYDGQEFVNFTTQDGLIHNSVRSIHCDAEGMLWFGTLGGVSRYDGHCFTNFTRADGLAHESARVLYWDTQNVLWFGTLGGGVSRCEGLRVTDPVDSHSRVSAIPTAGFTTFTTRDGLAHNRVYTVHRSDDGALWVGTQSGVSRSVEGHFEPLTTEDGLVHNHVRCIYPASDGGLWFTTQGGVSRYAHGEFRNLRAQDGLVHHVVNAMCETSDGVLWFAMGDWPHEDGGVVHYDGNEFATFPFIDQLPRYRRYAYDIHLDSSNNLWFATHQGVIGYDGQDSTVLTKQDGLADDWVRTIHETPDGVLWFGTCRGISRYDGTAFASFTVEDGLAYNEILAIHRSPDGVMWFGTGGGGVSRYDGTSWSSLDTRDGLAGNTVWAIHQDQDGALWFGTDGGLSCYRPSRVCPKARIVAATTDQRHQDPTELPLVTAGTRVTIEYDSIDLSTHTAKRLYRCRLLGHDTDWSKPCSETQQDYADLEPGDYTFVVQAIDRDLNCSESATLPFTVQPDPRELEIRSLQTEIGRLQWEVGRKYDFSSIVGRSAAMKQMFALMAKAAEADATLTVLVTGETGTGKELVAKGIHYNSVRREHSLHELNCGAIPRDLVASTLFGHRKGAFTGALQDRPGLFEVASGGTLVLDEIGEMPPDAQVHLLRVLQERKVQRVGETESRAVDVRVIAITNRDLESDVREGKFREDLYYRLNVFPIHVPALRERLEDIPLLTEHLLRRECVLLDKEIDGMVPEAIGMLQGYRWPGNVRELENEIRRAVVLAEDGAKLRPHLFSSRLRQREQIIQDVLSGSMDYRQTVEHVQKRLIEDALSECQGNRSAAARKLGIHRPNLLRLIKRFGIDS